MQNIKITISIIEDYLERVIDESGSGQMVLKQGKRNDIPSVNNTGILLNKNNL